jgi:hypothetical protein
VGVLAWKAKGVLGILEQDGLGQGIRRRRNPGVFVGAETSQRQLKRS